MTKGLLFYKAKIFYFGASPILKGKPEAWLNKHMLLVRFSSLID